MDRLIKIFLIVVFLFLSCPAWSATYYVKNGGDDEAAGTSDGTAWATIAKVAATATDGDTVYFRSQDTWSSASQPMLTATAGVTYIGDVYGNGTRATLQATGTAAQVVLISVSTVMFKGFEIDMNSQNAGGLYIKATDAGGNISNITVDNCEIHGSAAAVWAYGLYVGGWGYSYARDVSNVTIKNTSVHDTQHEAITIYPSWTGGVLNTATNVTVRNCTTYNTGRNDVNHYFDIGIMVANRVRGAVLEYNVCYGSLGGMLVTNSGGGAPGDPTDIHIRYNILRNNTSGNYPYGLGLSTDRNVGPLSYASIYIYGNLIHSNGFCGILFAEDYGASTVYLYNNTVYHSGNAAGIKLWSSFSGTNGTYELKNNIINTTNVPAIGFDAAADAAFFTHNNNLYYRSDSASNAHVLVESTSYNRAGVTTWEASAQSTAPSFTGGTLPTGFSGTYGSNMIPNTDYFQLTVDSPAKDTGATLASYTGSINGAGLTTPIVRPLGAAFDIGAYEYGTVAESGGSAGSGFKLSGASINSQGATASCTTPTGDELTESFGDSSSSCWSGGDSTCNNTWTVFTGSPTIAAVPAGAPSNTTCTNGLSFDTTSAAETIYKDLGDGTIPNNVQVVITFSMYIDSSSIGAYSYSALVALNTSNTALESATLYSSVGLNKATAETGSANKIAAFGNSDFCTIDFAEDTWYNITLTLDAAADDDGSTLSDGTNSCNFTRDTDASRYLWAGAADTGIVGYIGNVRVSTP